MIGEKYFMRASELVKKIEPFLLFFGSKPVLVSDELDRLHKISDVQEVISENKGLERPGIPKADYLLIKLKSIRVLRESKVEVALEQDVTDLSEYQDIIRMAADCSRKDAVRILEEINSQDYLLLSGSELRRIRQHMEQQENDLNTLRESLEKERG